MAEGPAAGKMKVFISYSRRDVAFAGDLELALEDKGYEPLVDRHDIDPGDKWKDRLGHLIFSCDTVVFVLSEHSASSPICTWEVEEAARLGKRMLVVTPGPTPKGVAPPPQLSDINWIHCWPNPDIPGSSLIRGVIDLDRALKTDLAWLRQQTRLSEQAAIWRTRAEASTYEVNTSSALLRGNILDEAQAWMTATPANARVPDEIAAFIAASARSEAFLKAQAASQLAERETAVKAAEKANRRAGVFAWAAIVIAFVLSTVAVAGGYFAAQNYAASSEARSVLFAREAATPFVEGLYAKSILMALQGDPAAQAGEIEGWFNRDGYVPARNALVRAVTHNRLDATCCQSQSGVRSIAVHSDGERFLTGSEDGSVTLWRIGQVEPLATYAKHQGAVTSVAFHPDGQRFLTGSVDGTTKLWRIGEGEPLATYRLPDTAESAAFYKAASVSIDAVWSVAFHPDGERFLTGSGKTAKLWKIGRPEPLAVFYGHGDTVTSVVFHADGERFLTASGDGTAKLWQIGEAQPLKTYDEHAQPLVSIALHPDGDRFLTGSYDGTAKLWRIGQVESLETYRGDDSSFLSVAFHSDGERFLTGSGKTAKLWRIGEADPLATFSGHDNVLSSVVFHPDGKRFLTASQDGMAKLWRMEQAVPPETYRGHREGVAAVAFDVEGKRFLTGSGDGMATLWRMGEIEPLTMYHGDEDTDHASFFMSLGEQLPTGSIAFHPDGERFLTGSDAGAARLWRIGGAEPLSTYVGHSYGITSVAFHPDGERFLTASVEGRSKLWRIGDAEPLATYGGREGGVASVAFHPDGQRFLTGSGDGIAKLWRIGVAEPLATYAAHKGAVTSVTFHPDGERFLTGSSDRTVKLWRITADKPLATFSGHEDEVRSVAFHPDGELFLSGSSDRTAKLWRIGEDKPLATFSGHEGSVRSVAFHPDRERFLTGSADGTAKLWRIPEIVLASADEQVRMACETLREIGVMDFSEADWQRFPILDRSAPHPCRDVWGFDPRKGETGAKAG